MSLAYTVYTSLSSSIFVIRLVVRMYCSQNVMKTYFIAGKPH